MVSGDSVSTHGFHPLDLATCLEAHFWVQGQDKGLVGLVIHRIYLIPLDEGNHCAPFLYDRDLDVVSHGPYVAPLLSCENVLKLESCLCASMFAGFGL